MSVGKGKTALTGKSVVVHYEGKLQDGSKFDSSYDRGSPFSFTLGAGEVIKGWEIGREGMQEGAVRTLSIPPVLAYGETGAGANIPPNSTLCFKVELLSVKA